MIIRVRNWTHFFGHRFWFCSDDLKSIALLMKNIYAMANCHTVLSIAEEHEQATRSLRYKFWRGE